MTFRGWPVEAVEFFDGLLADNSKVYWQDHKDVYEQCVRAPMEELLVELADEFGAGKVFRPYRDVRFSKDKSPYKTAIAARLAGGGYVQMSADGLAAGCGLYRPAPDQLERYRGRGGGRPQRCRARQARRSGPCREDRDHGARDAEDHAAADTRRTIRASTCSARRG